ncbi:MAG: helix-turn-helix domain-containing protein [Chloroflexi bacterium]|jgi:excisionase family DNA binding protein|nr:helix-turn-helix domain-containing protein [Chloroflexota bacterium]
MNKNNPEVMTVKQLADYLQIDEQTVYRMARAGKIPAVKVAGQWRFKKDLIDQWLKKESLKKYKEREEYE